MMRAVIIAGSEKSCAEIEGRLPPALARARLVAAREVPPCDLVVVDQSMCASVAALRIAVPVLLFCGDHDEVPDCHDIDEIVRASTPPAEVALRVRQLLRTRSLEVALADSRERFDLIARATNDALWDWNVVENTAWWSDSYFERGGYSLDTVPSFEAWTRSIHPADHDDVVESFRQALESGATVWRCRYRHRMADGSYGHVLDRCYLKLSPEGRPVRVVGSVLDVTEHTRRDAAQRLLVEASERLGGLLDCSRALATIAALPVPVLADACAVHLLDEQGDCRRRSDSVEI